MKLETLAVHAGLAIDPGTAAVAPPIHLSTTFERAPDGSYPRGHMYIRNSNPGRSALESCLTRLEGGAAAAAFASGSAATAAVLQALRPGDHVVAPNDCYYGTARLLREAFGPWGLEASFVNMTDLDAVAAAIRPSTRLLWVETPSNPLLKVTDLERVAELAHRAGALCACDNTLATPALQQPLRLGADLVVHATTKYLAGHADVMGGAVITRAQDELFTRLVALQIAAGAVPSPFDCWLLRRSLATLPYRMRAHCEHAGRVAEFLEAQPRVSAVHYPGLASHPGHKLATRQLSGFGGVLSFQVRGGAAAALGVAAHVRLFTRATSFGSAESLIEHRASIEGPATRVPADLLRLSIGLEHPDDLIADLEQALAAAAS